MSGATIDGWAYLLVDAGRLYPKLDVGRRMLRHVHHTCEALLSDSPAFDDPTTDLATLLRRCAEQDRVAFRRLYDRQAARLHGIAMRITRQPALAADAVHDTFIALWQHAGSFDPTRGSAEAWLTSIARYRALDIARRRTREITGLEMPEEADPAPDALTKLAGIDEAASLRHCLEELEPDRRSLVVAAFVDGLTHTELAQQRTLPTRHRQVDDPSRPRRAETLPRAMSDAPEDRDLLAAEYVLGVLDAAESAEVEALAAREESVVLSIEQWQNRLAPLAFAVAPVTPPVTLWPRIAAAIGGFPQPATEDRSAQIAAFPRRSAWNSVGLWRAATAAAVALAAVFAGIVLRGTPGARAPIRRGPLARQRARAGVPRRNAAGRRHPGTPAEQRVGRQRQGPRTVGVAAGCDGAGFARRSAGDRQDRAPESVCAGIDAASCEPGATGRLAHGPADRPGAVRRHAHPRELIRAAAELPRRIGRAPLPM